MTDRTQVTYAHTEACGRPVLIGGELVGFCARGVDHEPLPCTHIISAFRPWWK